MPAHLTNIFTKHYYHEKHFPPGKSHPSHFLAFFFAAITVLVSGCCDNQITEIDRPEQHSLDTPEAYLEAIAKVQQEIHQNISSAIRKMDEKEFGKVMGKVEKVIERSPVVEAYSKAEGNYSVRKFSEEEYVTQNGWWEENKGDLYSALDPIISMESMMKMESLMTEFYPMYGSAEVDTMGWRAIMQKAKQDGLAKGTGLSCSSPQKVKINKAGIFPMPSTAMIMRWSGDSEAQSSCISCCIECCSCAGECRDMPWNSVATSFWNALTTGSVCAIAAAMGGPVTWSICAGVGIWTFNFNMMGQLWHIYRCADRCSNAPHCKICPRAFSEHWAGADCSRAHLW